MDDKLISTEQQLRDLYHSPETGYRNLETMKSTNDALAEYANVKQDLEHQEKTQTPRLDYTPSREMRHYKNLVSGALAVGLGGLAYYVV